MDDDTQLTGLRLVDSRLYDPPRSYDESVDYPSVLRAYHDLRGILGRRYRNPARKLNNLCSNNPAATIVHEMNLERGNHCDPGNWTQQEADRAMALMRSRLGSRKIFFDDFDITEALVNPNEPIRSRDFNKLEALNKFGEAKIIKGLRTLLLSFVSAGCCDDDLLRALHHLSAPLIASGIARRQVWRSVDGQAAVLPTGSQKGVDAV